MDGNQVETEAVGRYMRDWADDGSNPADSALKRAAKRVLPHRLREPLRSAVTAAIRPAELRRCERLLASGQLLRLNLGSGASPIEGLINVDFAGAPVELRWNLAKGIPFPDGSVDWIYSAHVFEHIPQSGALALLHDCRRALSPDGVIRIVVPDAGELLGSYSETNGSTWVDDFPAPMLAVNALFYEHGHRMMWDAHLLVAAMEDAGFRDVHETAYAVSAMDPCPDQLERRDGSLFVEGRGAGAD